MSIQILSHVNNSLLQLYDTILTQNNTQSYQQDYKVLIFNW